MRGRPHCLQRPAPPFFPGNSLKFSISAGKTVGTVVQRPFPPPPRPPTILPKTRAITDFIVSPVRTRYKHCATAIAMPQPDILRILKHSATGLQAGLWSHSRCLLGDLLSDFGQQIMDIRLHVGAHRTGTTKFSTLFGGSFRLRSRRVATCVWGAPDPRGAFIRAVSCVGRPCDLDPNLGKRARFADFIGRGPRCFGATQLLISDENMIGSTRHSVAQRAAFSWMANVWGTVRFHFGGARDAVVAGHPANRTRWWTSARGMAYTVGRGHPVPRCGIARSDPPMIRVAGRVITGSCLRRARKRRSPSPR